MDPRAERAARNEALFRDVNERVAEAAEGFELELFDALCECHESACTASVPITRHEYETVRGRGDRFVMLDGHEDPAVERIVERKERFVVAEKLGDGAKVARELDPRGD